jgi:hypothetical protein
MFAPLASLELQGSGALAAGPRPARAAENW